MLEDRRLMATVIPVTSALDTGSGTLRDAIAQAASTSGPVAIDFRLATPATIDLTQGQLALTDTAGPISIVGPGASRLTIDGGGDGRVMQIDPGVSASMSGLTLTDGSDNFGGGGLYNAGTGSLTDCTISGNSGEYGGGVLNDGTLSLAGCQITDNSTGGGAGGVSNYGTVSIDHCTISGNFSAGAGDNGGAGGVETDFHSMTLADSVISGNTCWGFGGGINVEGGDATIERCTIADNTAFQAGGGLTVVRNPSPLAHNGTVLLRDCDFTGNVAGEYGGGACIGSGSASPSPGNASASGCRFAGNVAREYGGGIAVTAGSLTIANSSITGNSAGSQGGGLFAWASSFGGTSDVSVQDVTISTNTAAQGGGVYNAGDLTMTDARIVADTASGDGGGIANAGTLSMTGTSLRGNTAAADGGGLYNSGTATLIGCLVSGNSAASGGGIYAASGGSVTLDDTIVSHNRKDDIIGTVTYD
jgi:predicted outer membrane repeat protein